MFIEILLATLVGITAGIITGLTPGIHINLVCAVVLTASSLILKYISPLSLGCFTIAMAITHTFLDALPSIYLGAPSEDQILNALPGHRMLLEGKAHEAVVLTIIGSFFGLIMTIIFFPVIIKSMDFLYPLTKDYMGIALVIVVCFLIFREPTLHKKCWSFMLFFTSGILGILVLNFPEIKQPLFHLLSGLFGLSLLVMSILEKSTIPQQTSVQEIIISKLILIKSTIGAVLAGYFAGFLPGFGSSQAAIVAQTFLKNIEDKGFLILVGGINTVNMVVSIATIYLLEKARNGAVLTVGKIMGKVSFEVMILFLIVSIIVAGIAALLSLSLSKIFAYLISKAPYAKIITGIIIFIILLSFYFDGLIGLLILGTATAVGITASLQKIGKNHLMGCLLVPVIVYFIG
ncbi:tripartite tricarboxylate transporter permease [Candidatus Woesearchaeota archaeon]|nr:tripartite tricarboxylate transporter permease [Candidatus Woesearchaeota archaeon]